jgi:hypothetical protein
MFWAREPCERSGELVTPVTHDRLWKADGKAAAEVGARGIS